MPVLTYDGQFVGFRWFGVDWCFHRDLAGVEAGGGEIEPGQPDVPLVRVLHVDHRPRSGVVPKRRSPPLDVLENLTPTFQPLDLVQLLRLDVVVAPQRDLAVLFRVPGKLK